VQYLYVVVIVYFLCAFAFKVAVSATFRALLSCSVYCCLLTVYFCKSSEQINK